MSNVSTQQAQMSQNIKAIVDAPFGEPITIQTPTGMCAIFNAHLVSQKLIGIVGAMLNLEEWGDVSKGGVAGPHVMSIVFRADGLPANGELHQIFGVTHSDCQSFAINLKRCFKEALDVATVMEPAVSIRATLWNELLTTIAHEMHHTATIANIPEESRASWSADDASDEEAKAKEWARNIILELATSDIDIEPPAFSEEPLFSMLFMAANLQRLADPNTYDELTAAWENQLKMLAEGWAWHDPASGVTCKSFVDWISIEESGEDTVIGNQAVVINNDTGAESNPMVTPAYEIMPVGSAMTHIEAVDAAAIAKAAEAHPDAPTIFTSENPAPEAEKVLYTTGPEVTAAFTSELFGEAEALVDSAGLDAAEAADLMQFAGDDGEEGVYQEEVLTYAHPGTPVTPAQPIRNGNLFTEDVPQPTPAPEPEERQAYDPHAVAATAHAVFQRCFQHIFNKCAPVNGVFQNAAAVYDAINISDIPGHEIVVGCDTIDAQGRFKKHAHVPGWVKGTIFNTSKLPAFHIYLNVGGQVLQRRIFPQNANKANVSGDKARAGNHIGWICDAAPGGQFLFGYENGVLTPCRR